MKLLRFLLLDLSAGCFLYLLAEIVNFASTLCMFLRWFASTKETKGPFTAFGAGPSYFFKNLLCKKYLLRLKHMIYC